MSRTAAAKANVEALRREGHPIRRRSLVAAAAALPFAARADDPKPVPWPPSRATPAVALPIHEGALTWTLAAARGKPLLLNFWASWCEPCRSELPSLELLEQRHEAQQLQVLAVNFRETDTALARYLAQHPLSLTVLRDADGALARAFGVRIFPSTIAIGRDGRARFTVTGECDWLGTAPRRWLEPLLRT